MANTPVAMMGPSTVSIPNSQVRRRMVWYILRRRQKKRKCCVPPKRLLESDIAHCGEQQIKRPKLSFHIEYNLLTEHEIAVPTALGITNAWVGGSEGMAFWVLERDIVR